MNIEDLDAEIDNKIVQLPTTLVGVLSPAAFVHYAYQVTGMTFAAMMQLVTDVAASRPDAADFAANMNEAMTALFDGLGEWHERMLAFLGVDVPVDEDEPDDDDEREPTPAELAATEADPNPVTPARLGEAPDVELGQRWRWPDGRLEVRIVAVDDEHVIVHEPTEDVRITLKRHEWPADATLVVDDDGSTSVEAGGATITTFPARKSEEVS